MKKLLLILTFLAASFGWSATVTISNTGGNWSNTAAWVGAATPAVTDDVVATGSSGPITIDTATDTCKSMVLTGYTNGMNFGAGNDLIVAGGVTLASGMALSGPGTLIISAAATLLSNNLTFPGSVSFTGSNTKTMGDSWTVVGSFGSINTVVINGNTINVGGNFAFQGPCSGTTAFNINGSGSLVSTNTVTGITNPVTINTSGSVSFFSGGTYNIGVGGYLGYVAGTFVSNGNSFFLLGNCTLNTGPSLPFDIFGLQTGITCSVTLLNDLYLTGPHAALDVITGTTGAYETLNFIGAHNITCSILAVQNGQLSIPSSQSITITQQINVQGAPSSFTETGAGCSIVSGTPGQRFHLIYAGDIYHNKIVGYNIWTDVDATGSTNPIWAFFANGSVISNCLNFYTGLYTNPTSVPKDFIIP